MAKRKDRRNIRGGHMAKKIKVIIELEFDTYDPTTQDIIDYINELGLDLGYEKIINK